MNKKLFYLSILLVFISILYGCSGQPTIPGPSINEEAQIKSVIHEYWLAISNQNWNKARSYCVYGSSPYYSVSQIENIVNNLYLYCNIVTLNAVANIQNVSVSGNYAQAYVYVYLVKTACGYSDTETGYITLNLQKISNLWKLY